MNVLLPARCAFFVSFVVCNAVLTSVGVWNIGLAQLVGLKMDVDMFVILLGALSLAFIFPLIIVELVRHDSFSGRVWFECAWVATFFALNFCAAVAMSSIGPGIMCSAHAGFDSCVSTRVILAFSWLCTLFLLTYFILLVVSALLHRNENAEIWSASIRSFDWGGARTYLNKSGPKVLELPRFVEKSRPGSIVAPKPQRPADKIMPVHRSGSVTEHGFQLRTDRTAPVPTVAPSQQSRQPTAAALYPQHMQSTLASQAPYLPPIKQMRAITVTPPPLGDWPRPNIMSEPRSKRPEHTRGATIPPSSSPSRAPISRGRRSTSGEWRKIPPPLDLSKISSFTRLQ